MNFDKPIYVQIADFVENEIITGKLNPGEASPSTNELSRLFNINPATAGKGLQLLVDEEILFKKRGIGMIVTDDAKQIVIEKRKNDFFENTIPLLRSEMNRLGLDIEEVIEKLKEDKNA